MSDDTDDDRDVHVCELDDERQPSTAIVTAVAAVTNESPFELAPLGEVVDPDSLDALVSGPSGRRLPEDCEIGFVYAGCEVTVECERVLVREVAESEREQ